MSATLFTQLNVANLQKSDYPVEQKKKNLSDKEIHIFLLAENNRQLDKLPQ